jgi:uncharacterized protein (TIGR02246 family)
MDELYSRLQADMRHPRPDPEAIAAAFEAAQRLAAEADAEQAADDTAELTVNSGAIVCPVCGYRNREGNKFCGMCGVAVTEPDNAKSPVFREREGKPARELTVSPNRFLDLEPEPQQERHPSAGRSTVQETHHYHHHYHHHYFPGAPEGVAPRSAAESVRADPVKEEKLRSTAALRGEMSRAEAAVRRVTHEWVLACNTKHLDDLLDLYAADALVLRSNYPPVRGAAAIREFFFGALDAGLGEVELEPLRVDVAGDLAYEAGRCKALVPGAVGKRREERGKYLWVCARQSNGEWKLAADCWSADLTLTTLESDVPQNTGVKTSQPRKTS